MWIWQRPDWPKFQFDADRLAGASSLFVSADAELVGRVEVGEADCRADLAVELMLSEAIASYAIEGESLDRDSVRSSLLNVMGRLSESPPQEAGDAEDGAVSLIVDVRRNWDAPLSQQRLGAWQAMALAGRRMSSLQRGRYRRGPETMSIVSGNPYGPKGTRVHYEAPPSDRVPAEMDRFIEWFNGSRGDIDGLARAAVAHLWFEKIHPFDDGNGRVGRALSDMAISQALGRPTLSCLATAINEDRAGYYAALDGAGRDGMNVDPFLYYFSETALRSQSIALREVRFVLGKTRFLDQFGGRFNPRQRKAALRMLEEGSKGFQVGLSPRNYRAITKASSATATRDLAGLVRMGAMTATGKGRSLRYAIRLLDSPPHLLEEMLGEGGNALGGTGAAHAPRGAKTPRPGGPRPSP
ncbi:MAG: Fic family protein [Gammaproteobacteria bacterium]|nr:Fic family protein [Gammaproteobacteria bacterium]